MFKTAITIAIFSSGAAFAAIPVMAPSTQPQQLEQGQRATVIDPHGAGVFDQLSMGPDPGGKNGDTVTPTTTNTNQPSTEGTGASSQSGASGTTPPSGAASTRTDPTTRPTGGSDTPKH
jgi:hypothetical protein